MVFPESIQLGTLSPLRLKPEPPQTGPNSDYGQISKDDLQYYTHMFWTQCQLRLRISRNLAGWQLEQLWPSETLLLLWVLYI